MAKEVLEIVAHVAEIIGRSLEALDGGLEVFEFFKQYEKLKSDLEFMKRNLQGINETKFQDQTGILALVEQNLRSAEYEVEDLIEECKPLVESPKSKITKWAYLVIARGRRKRLNEIKKNLKGIGKQMKFSLSLNDCLSNRQEPSHRDQYHPIEYSIRMNNEGIVGLETVSLKIRQWIIEVANMPLKVIGIFGMAGVGKTTLARKIWKDMNSMSSQCGFDYVLFSGVSLSFDLEVVIKDLLEKMTAWNNERMLSRGDDLVETLHKLLLGKRYLIILDNVWQTTERLWWNSLMSALPEEKNGSSVVITTRHKEVATSMGATEKYMHHHIPLSENDSWLLFSKIVFCTNKDHQPPVEKVGNIAKTIVGKCGGLPLAIKVVAGVMFGKEPSIFNWRRMSKHFEEELQEKGKVLDISLRMSYEELPWHLKFCMLCFSIFPEGYEASLEEVMDLWASQGLIHQSQHNTATEIGEKYFDELINRSLLLGRRKDVFEMRFQTCELHGTISAMVQKIAREKNFMLMEDEKNQPIPCLSPRVGFIRGSNMDHLSKSNSKLRILVGKGIPESNELTSKVKSKMCKQKFLRVLDLSFTTNDPPADEALGEDWLEGIRSLTQLTCLKIQNSKLKGITKYIKNLRKLHTLRISHCYNLKKLPPEIVHLKTLTVLDVSTCSSLEYLPIQIEGLTNLEILFGFKPATSRVKGGCRMASLKKLTQLRELWMLMDSEDQIENEDLVVLSEVKKLQVLAITLEDNNNAALITKLDCELPSPLGQLHHLYLHNFPGEDNPRWLNPISLPNLSFLHIYDSNIRSFSPGFFGNGEKVWQFMEVLVLTCLNKLDEQWPCVQAAMPCLSFLKINECPKLNSLPCQVRNGVCCWNKQ